MTISVCMIKEQLYMYAISRDFGVYFEKKISEIRNLVDTKSVNEDRIEKYQEILD